MLGRVFVATGFAVSLLTPAIATADVTRCATGETELAYAGTDIAEISGDTGWFPAGFAAQLRLTARVVGHTNVTAGYQAKACWEGDMEANLAGAAGSGLLDVAYGVEVKAFARVHATILFQTFSWEGEIKLPYIPPDLLLEGTSAFDPRLDTTNAASVSDSTSSITLISTNTLANLISLGGISGGLRISMTPSMTSTYRATKTTAGGTTIDSTSDLLSIEQPSSGFHSNVEVPIVVDGKVRYAPRLTFNAGFDVSILGYRVVDWQLASIPVSLPALERTVKLTGEAAYVPLPELDGIGNGARMDFSAGDTQTLRVKNLGESALELAPATFPAGVTVTGLSIAAGAAAELRITVTPDALASGTERLVFETNDPDRPSVTVELGKNIGGTDVGEPPVIEQDDGGCSAAGGGQSAGLLLALGALIARIRSRRRAVA